MKPILTYKYRIRPNRAQAEALDAMLGDFCTLYNACLEQRIDAYQRRGVSIRFAGQAAEIKAIRAEVPGLDRWSYAGLTQVMRRVDKTYAAFFRRGHGFPRFRSRVRFDSADMKVGDGLTIRKSARLGVVGVPGEVKVVWHRPLPEGAKLGQATIRRSCGKWYACFSVETADVLTVHSGSAIGIDLGLSNLIATSDGDTIPAPQFARRAAASVRRTQRALSRCKRGSKRRAKVKARLAKANLKVANQRRDFAHKLSRSLANEHGLIAFEKLNVTGLARGMLARSVHDAAWTQIVQFTTYKAESAGGSVVLVDPRGTSQTCPDCGTVARKSLSQRWHSCPCGCELDRDVAAARVVLARGLMGREPAFGREVSGVPHGLSEKLAA